MKKMLITLAAAAFIAFGYTSGALATGMDHQTEKGGAADHGMVTDQGKDPYGYYGTDPGWSGSDQGDVREYYGTDEGLSEDFDADPGDVREYYGTDEGLSEEFDPDQGDIRGYYGADEGFLGDENDTHEYFGTDESVHEGFDAERDLDTQRDAGIDSGIQSE